MSLNRQDERSAIAKASKMSLCMYVLAAAIRKYIRKSGRSTSYDLQVNLRYLMNQCRQGKRNASELSALRVSLSGRHAIVHQKLAKISSYCLVYTDSWIKVAENIGDRDAANEMRRILY